MAPMLSGAALKAQQLLGRRGGFKDRLYAKIMTKIAAPYNEKMGHHKQRILEPLRRRGEAGPALVDVLEVGAGTGANWPYYVGPFTRITAVDPNPATAEHLQQSAKEAGLAADRLTFVQGIAEALPVPDCSQDAVVATLTLCSVADPALALAEVRRVLKPGGTFHYLEHVAGRRGTLLRAAQEGWNPLHNVIFDGCNCNRETWAVVEAAGFTSVTTEHVEFPDSGPMWMMMPHIAGVATKAG